MQELNVFTLLNILGRRIKWLILAAAVAAVLCGGYVLLFVETSYASTCSMYVMNLSVDESGNASLTTGISTSGLSASQQMVNEYISLLKSKMVIEDMQIDLREQGYEMSFQEILRSMTMSPKDETALLQIKATTNDPNKSKAVCDALMRTAPEKIQKVMLNLGTITPVDDASVGLKVSSSALRYAVIGGFVGAALCYVFFVLIFLLDNTIKSEQDLKNRLDVTVLGAVPDLHPTRAKKGGGYYYA